MSWRLMFIINEIERNRDFCRRVKFFQKGFKLVKARKFADRFADRLVSSLGSSRLELHVGLFLNRSKNRTICYAARWPTWFYQLNSFNLLLKSPRIELTIWCRVDFTYDNCNVGLFYSSELFRNILPVYRKFLLIYLMPFSNELLHQLRVQ